ncbi:MAG: FG-GAP-like repeat-containing protein [Deltaproteobacteria bacterium]|nr:FG-GAP-like repeat-containing protein [Deltaproteobacteria bacterium]
MAFVVAVAVVGLAGCGSDGTPVDAAACDPTACDRDCLGIGALGGTCRMNVCRCLTGTDAAVDILIDVGVLADAWDGGVDQPVVPDASGDASDTSDDRGGPSADVSIDLGDAITDVQHHAHDARSDSSEDVGVDVLLSPDVPDAGVDSQTVPDGGDAGSADTDVTTDVGCRDATTCASGCVDLQTDVHHCGSCVGDCSVLGGVDPTAVRCVAGSCSLTGACLPRRGDCDGVATNGCEADLTQAANCNACNARCGEPTPVCSAAGAAYACVSGCSPSAPTRCSGSCVDIATSALHCGRCDNACAAVSGATVACIEGACVSTCNAGFHRCASDGPCVLDSSVTSCGPSCLTCLVPPNAVAATCVDGVCGFICTDGYVAVPGACALVRAPRPLAPMSAATVTSRRPELKWNLGVGTDGARVELCRDRACTAVLEALDVAGGAVRPSADLPAGPIFWRLRGRLGASTGNVYSPTWQFVVGARSAPINTSWGSVLDLNGDGYADLAVGASGRQTGVPAGQVSVFLGRASGFPTTPDLTLRDPTNLNGFGYLISGLGDVNGDGFTDLAVVSAYAADNRGRVYVYLGSPTGVATAPATTLIASTNESPTFAWGMAGLGDVNGDGYADLAVGKPFDSAHVNVYHGGPTGLSSIPALTLRSGDSYYGNSVASAGDVNGDGFGDLAVTSRLGTGRAYLHFGGPTGISTVANVTLASPDAAGDFPSLAVVNAGDVNGDGFADLLMSQSRAEADTGRAHLFMGRATGPAAAPNVSLTGPDGAGGGFGIGIAGAGDVDGDGFADVAIGAPTVGMDSGSAFVLRGGVAGLSVGSIVRLPPQDLGRAIHGWEVVGLGDFNRDSFGDIAVAALGAGGNATGRVYVYLGASGGTPALPSLGWWGPGGANGEFGHALGGLF